MQELKRRKNVSAAKEKHFAFSLLNTVSVEKCWDCCCLGIVCVKSIWKLCWQQKSWFVKVHFHKFLASLVAGS